MQPWPMKSAPLVNISGLLGIIPKGMETQYLWRAVEGLFSPVLACGGVVEGQCRRVISLWRGCGGLEKIERKRLWCFSDILHAQSALTSGEGKCFY
jgi:hypothetical protein